MAVYSLLTLFKPSLSREAVTQALALAGKRVLDAGGAITQVQSHGHRPLAYEVKRHGERFKHGYMMRLDFVVKPEALPEVRKDLQVNTNLLRFMVSKLGDDPIKHFVPQRAQAGAFRRPTAPERAAAAAGEDHLFFLQLSLSDKRVHSRTCGQNKLLALADVAADSAAGRGCEAGLCRVAHGTQTPPTRHKPQVQDRQWAPGSPLRQGALDAGETDALAWWGLAEDDCEIMTHTLNGFLRHVGTSWCRLVGTTTHWRRHLVC